MNLVARQNYSNKKGGVPNTFIGGVASTISTPALLASKLAIDVSRITNFSIIGSDIKCKITGSYAMPTNAWYQNTVITYFNDNDNLVTSLGVNCFRETTSINDLIFNGVTSVSGTVILGSNIQYVLLLNCTTAANNSFQESKATRFTLSNLTSLGSTSGNDSVFFNITGSPIIVIPSYFQTNNSGAPDGDITYAVSRGATIRYKTNSTSPNGILDLSVGVIYNTAIQLNFTPPSSANAIDYYEIYVNGLYHKRIPKEGNFAVGLLPLTNYTIKVYAIDIFYNKSVVSNSISVTTTATNSFVSTGDSDANNYISASGISDNLAKESAARLIIDLKNNSLYGKCHAVYLFKGTTSSQQKFNAKNPIDTDAGFRLTFSGSGTFSDLGYQCNGIDAFADTHLVNSLVQTINNQGVTVVTGTNNTNISTAVELGSFQNPNGVFISTKRIAGGRKDIHFGATIIQEVGINESRCVLTGTRTGTNVINMYKNGSLLANGTGSGTMSSLPYDIGRLSAVNGQFSNQRIQIVIIHEGMSSTEVATLHSIIDLSESIAGRKTW